MDTTASVLVVVGFVAVVAFLIFMGVAVRMILRRLTNVINAVERRDKFTPPTFLFSDNSAEDRSAASERVRPGV